MSQIGVMARLSIMMFLQFFVWGAWYVTVGNYMDVHEMGQSIGLAYAVGPVAAIISPLFLGMVADRYFPSERVLGCLHLLGGLIMLAAPSVGQSEATSELFIGILFLHMLCYMPTLGLTNTLAFANLTNQETQFPLIRVFGTIGWIAANFVVSKILHADTDAMQFYVTGGAAILLGAYSFSLPHTPPPAAGKTTTVWQVLGLDALRMMGQRSFAVFIISSFLICIPLAAYYAFAPVFVRQAGAENPAYLMSWGQVAEIFFMLVMPLFFVRLGVKYMLLVGMLAWVSRYALFSIAAPDTIWWMIMLGILLHGICYDFFFVTGFIYVDKKASRDIRGQAQGFLVLVTQGFGLLIGALLSQWIYNRTVTAEGTEALEQWQNFWLIPCIFAGVIMVAFALLFHDRLSKAQRAGVDEGDVAASKLTEENL